MEMIFWTTKSMHILPANDSVQQKNVNGSIVYQWCIFELFGQCHCTAYFIYQQIPQISFLHQVQHDCFVSFLIEKKLSVKKIDLFAWLHSPVMHYWSEKNFETLKIFFFKDKPKPCNLCAMMYSFSVWHIFCLENFFFRLHLHFWSVTRFAQSRYTLKLKWTQLTCSSYF